MKLGILHLNVPGTCGVDEELSTQGLQTLLRAHELTHVVVAETTPRQWLPKARQQDAWILLGSSSEVVRGLSTKLRIPLISIPLEDAVLFAKLQPLYHAESRTVFCPAEERNCLPLYRALSRQAPTLLLANRAADLERGAHPGNTSFFSPRFPKLHGTAIGSAARVVSFRLLPALAAVANGIPAVLVPEVREAWIPCLGLDPTCEPDRFLGQQERTFQKYPWRQVREKIAERRKQTIQVLKKQGIESSAAQPALRIAGSPTAAKKLHVASISDSHYLPFLLGFIENILSFESAARVVFYIAALDERVGPFLKRQYPNASFVIWELKDLWAPPNLKRIQERTVGFQAFSSKPRLLRRAVAAAKAPVVYCDSDVHFFTSPHTLREALGEDQVLLFPQWNDVFSAARKDGLFNAGMMVVGPESEPFLNWWSGLCLETCSFSEADGTFGDQGYLDFAPVYFDGVSIYRDGNHDVAKWNLKSLSIGFPEGLHSVPSLGNGQPVGSYHAAYSDSLGIFEAKFAWDQLVAFFSSIKNPDQTAALFRNTLLQQRNHWLTLSRALALEGKLRYPLSPDLARLLTGDLGRKLFSLLAGANRSFTTKPSGNESADPDGFWIAALRTILRSETKRNSDHGNRIRHNR